jgi:hypothetical protein
MTSTQSAIFAGQVQAQTILLSGSVTSGSQAATKTYVDESIPTLASISGGPGDYGVAGQVLTTTGAAAQWGASSSGTAQFSAMNAPHGFENLTDSVITYDSTNKILTIAPTGVSFNVWVSGIKYTISSTLTSTAHAATAGMYYFYIDSSATLKVLAVLPNFFTAAFVAFVYYYSSSIYLVEEERHGCVMDQSTHLTLHLKVGTYYVSGLALSGYTLNTNTNASMQWTSASGVIADEDLRLTNGILAITTPNYAVMYLDSTAKWTWQASQAMPFLSSATYIYYNQNTTGSTWALTAAANNQYVNYYILYFPALFGPQTFCLMGQTVYTSSATAQAEVFTQLSVPITFPEYLVLYQLCYRTNSGNTTTGRVQLFSVRTVSLNSLSSSAVYNTSNHQNLSGLQLAATGVTWGHIDDQPQTIAGIKTFSDETDSSSSITGSVVTLGGLGVAKKATLGTGLVLPTTGGTPTVLNYYEEANLSIAATGAISTTLTGSIVRVGAMVMINVTPTAQITSLSGTTIDVAAGQLPARFNPARTYVGAIGVWTGQYTLQMGAVTVTSTGAWTIVCDMYNNNFPGPTALIGIRGGSLIWSTV